MEGTNNMASSFLCVHIHLFPADLERPLCASVETFQLSYCVLFWFICAFLPETSSLYW